MKYRIVKIELKDDNLVVLWLKKVGNATIVPKIDDVLSDPTKLIELGKQMGINYFKAIEEMMQFDAVFTIDYDEYNLRDLKVGDIVEIKIEHVER